MGCIRVSLFYRELEVLDRTEGDTAAQVDTLMRQVLGIPDDDDSPPSPEPQEVVEEAGKRVYPGKIRQRTAMRINRERLWMKVCRTLNKVYTPGLVQCMATSGWNVDKLGRFAVLAAGKCVSDSYEEVDAYIYPRLRYSG